MGFCEVGGVVSRPFGFLEEGARRAVNGGNSPRSLSSKKDYSMKSLDDNSKLYLDMSDLGANAPRCDAKLKRLTDF